MSERGDYRSIYCAFWDDADVHALGHLEYRVLTTLKGTLPASGIGVVYLSQLAERCAATADEVRAALSALAKPLPGKTRGWIIRERNVAWIVNALRFEPTLTPTNEKHRTYLRERLLAPLGARPIVEAYKRYYAEWFPAEDAVPKPKKTKPVASPIPIDRVSDHSPFQSFPALPVVPSSSREEESIDEAAEASPPTTEPHSAGAVLAAAANRGITEKWGEQPNPLRWDAGTTIAAAEAFLAAGIPIDFARDAIYTSCLSSKNDEPPRSVNYFIGAVLDLWKAKLARADASALTPNVLPIDGPRSPRPRTSAYLTKDQRDAAAAREREIEQEKARRDRRYHVERNRAIADWKIAHPAELAEFEAEIKAAHFPGQNGGMADQVREQMLILKIIQVAQLPSIEDWSARNGGERGVAS